MMSERHLQPEEDVHWGSWRAANANDASNHNHEPSMQLHHFSHLILLVFGPVEVRLSEKQQRP